MIKKDTGLKESVCYVDGVFMGKENVRFFSTKRSKTRKKELIFHQLQADHLVHL